MTAEQAQMFERMKATLQDMGAPFNQLSDNHIMRYL
jgi:hypothetical protein